MEISKELLGNTIGKEIKEFVIEKNELRYILENDSNTIPELYYINIYELAHKCKEWAYNQGYMMKIENHYLNSIQIQIRKPTANSMYKEPWKKTFENEIEGMIYVCQWILDNKA